jgi:hypothetical protein
MRIAITVGPLAVHPAGYRTLSLLSKHRDNLSALRTPAAGLLSVNPWFERRMQIEDRKNVIVDSVVFASNAIHGIRLHGFALSTETRLAIRHIAYPVRMEPLTSAQSDATAGARIRKLHIPVNSQASSYVFDTPSTRTAPLSTFLRNSARWTWLGCLFNWKM